jgi:hypothetical protein
MAKKFKGGKRYLLLILSVVGLLLALVLIRYESDLRSSAKEVVGCKVCKKGKCVKNDRKCSSQANECSSNADCSTAKKSNQKQPIYKYQCNTSTGQCMPNLYGDHDSKADCERSCIKKSTKSKAIVKDPCPTGDAMKARCVKVNTSGATYCPGLIRPYCCPVGKVFSHNGFDDSGDARFGKVCCDKTDYTMMDTVVRLT